MFGKFLSKKFNSGGFRYPLEALTETTDYLQFTIVEYQSTKQRSGGSLVGSPGSRRIGPQGTKDKATKILGNIILQMPSNIQDGNAVDYGESKMNTLIGAAAGAISSGIEGAGKSISELLQGNIDNLKRAFGATLTSANKAISDPDTQKTIAAALSGTAIGALGGNVNANQLISRASGQVLNPNLELLFQGVGIRNFPFQFQFFPRNPHEGKTVMNIIRKLKTEMAPRRTAKDSNSSNGVFIRTPSVFQLTYMKGSNKHPFLNSFLPAVLSDMKVNYSASGAHSTFYDGTPTHIRMDLQFKELNPIYAEDYDNVGGVGY